MTSYFLSRLNAKRQQAEGKPSACCNCGVPFTDDETPAAYADGRPLCQPCAVEFYE